MIESVIVLLLLAAAVAGVGAAARFLDRRIPNAALALFLLLAVLPYPRAFVSDRTPLPLDHAMFTRPWYVDGSGLTPHNPYLNDIATQILPWAEATRLAWREGALPLRDRWDGCGTPLAGNSVSAAFSPLTLVSLLLPLVRGFTLIVTIRLLLAAAGMWLWVRELRVSEGAAAFAAVAFTLSFTFVPPWIFYPQSGVFCLWPWMLFLVERSRDERGRGRAAAALAAVFVLTVLAGHPESAALGSLFAVLWLAGRWLLGDLRDAPRLARTIAVAAAAALGLTAFLLFPSILAIAASGRIAAAARPYWQPHLSLLPHGPRWAGIPPAFFPHTLGNAVSSPTLPGGTGTFCEMAMGYVGIAAWMAALLVMRPGSRRSAAERVLWAILLCGFGVAVCLWPLAEIFAQIPGYRYVFPLRFNGWVALAAPAIAALELDRYGADVPARPGRTVVAAVLAPAVLGLAAIGLYLYFRVPHALAGGHAFQKRQLLVVLGILAICAAAALAARKRPSLYVAALTVVCGAELLYQWRGLNRLYSPSMLFPDTPLLRYLRGQGGAFRVLGEGPVLFPSTNVFARLEDIRTHDAVERRDYMAFLDATCGYPYGDYFKMIRNADAAALDFLNVRYVLADPHASPPGPRWRAVYDGADGTVFENSRVLPRAFAPRQIRFVAAPEPGIVPVLDAAAAFGDSFRQIVTIQDWAAVAYVAAPGQSAELENPPVVISDYSEQTNAASFHARVPEGRGPGFVLLSLVQDGGWTARDEKGGAVPVFLANGPFLAVRVPPGESRVALCYRPPGMGLGTGISVATLVILAAAAVVRSRR